MKKVSSLLRIQSERKTLITLGSRSSQSFTLVELLIVIGILAILTAAIVLILNPAELLRQSRDTTRMSDLASIHSAVSLLLTQNPSVSLGTTNTIYISLPDTSPTCINLSLPTLPSGYTYQCVSQASSSLINGSGWLPLNLASSSIGSLPKLPLDPTNTTSSGLYYTYTTNGTQYELTSSIESTKYKLGGGSDKAATDGGIYTGLYEQGTNLTLLPIDYGDPSLVGYWTFDEGSGSVVYDRSGKGNHGAWSGSGTHYIAGKVGKAGQFNGSDNYVNSFDSQTLNFNNADFSIVLWINTNELPNTTGIIEKNPSTNAGFSNYALWKSGSGAIYFYVGNGIINQYDTVASNALIQNTWSHIVATFQSRNRLIKIYKDGIFNAQTTTVINPTTTTGVLGIGSLNSSYYFNGFIDDVRIYNRALSDAEIKALYNATK